MLEAHGGFLFGPKAAKLPVKDHNHTVFSVCDTDELCQRAIEAINQVVGDLTEPGAGILFTVPVDTCVGMAPNGLVNSVEPDV
ncbi:MAG: hypothetical protein AB1331_07175 [Bacillota bacterium]